MADILAEILASKRAEVERAKAERPRDFLEALPAFRMPTRNFYGAVAAPALRRPNLIAEIKRRSPSAGVLVEAFDPQAIAQMYTDAGAQALSVLTDEPYFDGRLEYLAQVKQVTPLPVLRKDFIVDEYQIAESRAYGADAILLIAEALSANEITRLALAARQLNLAVLVEVHTRETLLKVLPALPGELREQTLLGINNRDLKVQRTDVATTVHVAEIAPPGMPIVSESGLKTRRDVERVHQAGARALLIGETLLRAADPAAKIRELLGA